MGPCNTRKVRSGVKTAIGMGILVLKMSLISGSMAGPKVIYGEDDRRDPEDVTDNRLLSLADSTVALIDRNKLSPIENGEAFEVPAINNRESNLVCSTERFAHQTVASFCSGTLVTENWILTAGHCIENEWDCSKAKFVFGFEANRSNEYRPRRFPKAEVYGCKRLVRSQKIGQVGLDYALIELDRKVTNHKPVPFSIQPVAVGDALTVIGHPSGLPRKIAGGAQVRASVNRDFFVANLDTYGGNSGSGVFNSKTGKLVGVLVRGENDYNWDMTQGCRVSNACENGHCRGEDVTRITRVHELIAKAGPFARL